MGLYERRLGCGSAAASEGLGRLWKGDFATGDPFVLNTGGAYGLTAADVALRLAMAILLSGVIGYDREFKGRPAGIRTHILVCVGATAVAFVQRQVQFEYLTMLARNTALAGAISTDPTRLISQIVSGIGFLGAGTIIVTKRSVSGLTTAATLWATAGLGIAVGMGYYLMSVFVFAAILVATVAVKRVVRVRVIQHLEIRCADAADIKQRVYAYCSDRNIHIRDEDFGVEMLGGERVFTSVFQVEFPKDAVGAQAQMVEDLSALDGVLMLRILNVV